MRRKRVGQQEFRGNPPGHALRSQEPERSSLPDGRNRCAYSLKSCRAALLPPSRTESEIRRQIIELEAGRDVVQATRGFDALTSETFHLRSKEDAPDYRYMPDPELGAVIISDVSSLGLLARQVMNSLCRPVSSQFAPPFQNSPTLLSIASSLSTISRLVTPGSSSVLEEGWPTTPTAGSSTLRMLRRAEMLASQSTGQLILSHSFFPLLIALGDATGFFTNCSAY